MSGQRLSPAIERIKASPTVAMARRVGELKRAGVDVIGLSVGEPDFPTPPHVIEAVERAMRGGQIRYTDVDGMPEMKDAIARKLARDNGLSYTREQISVGAGGKQVLFNALVATLARGDQVVVPAPYWVSYPDIVRFAGAKPVIVPTSAETGYRMSPEQLDKALTDKTRWLILNSPSNPTGTAYDAGELKAFGEVLARYPHVMILTDDIYEHIWFAKRPFATIAAACPELKDRTLTLNGVSKGYAMTGWRIGYGAGPEWLVRAMAKLQSQSTGNPATMSQMAAIAALDGPTDYLAERNASFRERRDDIVQLLSDTPGFECPMPDGAFYVFPDCGDLIGAKRPDGGAIEDDVAIAEYLLDEARVAVVAGSAFGHPGAVRISYAVDNKRLIEAGRRIQAAISKLNF